MTDAAPRKNCERIQVSRADYRTNGSETCADRLECGEGGDKGEDSVCTRRLDGAESSMCTGTYRERMAAMPTRRRRRGRRRTRSPRGQMNASPRAYDAWRSVGMLVTRPSVWSEVSVGRARVEAKGRTGTVEFLAQHDEDGLWVVQIGCQTIS